MYTAETYYFYIYIYIIDLRKSINRRDANIFVGHSVPENTNNCVGRAYNFQGFSVFLILQIKQMI